MAIIRPFKAVRPHEKLAHLVASVPYDVVSRKEAAEFSTGNPISFLRVTRSEIEMDINTDPYSEEVYLKAKSNLERLINNEVLTKDSDPYLYVYKLTMNDISQIGIAATFAVEDYDNDVIKKHEKTRKVKEDDRTNHILTTEAQTGPVFLTYKGIQLVDKAVNETIKKFQPIYDFTAKDGVKHQVWIMPADISDSVVSEIAKAKNLYIADGHHRAASASRVQKIKKEKNVNHNGEEEYNFFLAVLFPSEQLRILPYNRTVRDLNGMSKNDFIEKIKSNFTVEEAELSEPKTKRNILMYLGEEWYLLKPNQNIKEAKSYGDNLDVSILQNYLLNPILGIDDPRTNDRIDFIGGIRGTNELTKLVDEGKSAVAFSLYPVSIDDLINISDAGEIMPPKSTWFEPKLRDGLLIHTL